MKLKRNFKVHHCKIIIKNILTRKARSGNFRIENNISNTNFQGTNNLWSKKRKINENKEHLSIGNIVNIQTMLHVEDLMIIENGVHVTPMIEDNNSHSENLLN